MKPQPTGARFRPRADAAEFVGKDIPTQNTMEARVLIEAPAEVIRQRTGRWPRTEEADLGRYHVMTLEDSDRPVIALGMTGTDFQVIDSRELTERLRDWSARDVRAAAKPNS